MSKNAKCEICGKTRRAALHTGYHADFHDFSAPGAKINGWTVAQIIENNEKVETASIPEIVTRMLKEYRTGGHSTATRGTYSWRAQELTIVRVYRKYAK